MGLVVIDAANPFFSDVARGVEDTVQRGRLALVLLGNSAGDDEPGAALPRACSTSSACAAC